MNRKSRAKTLFTTTTLAAAIATGALALWAMQASSKAESTIVTTEPPEVEIARIEPKPVRL